MALDVIFLVDGSERSLVNFNKHKAIFPHAKKCVTALTGIQATKLASKIANTSNFFLVDHNFAITADVFDFSFVPEEHDKQFVHIWRYIDKPGNPQLGLMPYQGGVHMFSKAMLRTEETDLNKLGKGIKYQERCASRPIGYDVVMIVIGDAGYEQNLAQIEKYGSAKLVFAETRSEAYEKARDVAETDSYFVIDSNYSPKPFYFDHRIEEYDMKYVHVWNCVDSTDTIRPGAIQLLHKSITDFTGADFEYSFGPNTKFHDKVISHWSPELPSIVFISYDEPNADANWQALVKRFPHAKRVHKVKGILNAHKQAAQLASTGTFFVVDGDATIADDFDFRIPFSEHDQLRYVHIWKCRNPANGLEYGYGGVKMFHRTMFDTFDKTIVDMTTLLGEGVKMMDQVASVTHFNSTDMHAFRSAFRECSKLASGVIKNSDDKESLERLTTWTTKAEGPFSEYVLLGARLGAAYGKENADDIEALQRINDFAWLKQNFRQEKMTMKSNELLYTKYSKIDVKTITNLTNILYNNEGLISLEELRDSLSQFELLSKFWLIDEVNKITETDAIKNVLMVEGANGILANLFFQLFHSPTSLRRVVSLDNNPRFQPIADALNVDNVIDQWRFKAGNRNPYEVEYDDMFVNIYDNTGSMKRIGLEWDVLINPHCEHLYDLQMWSSKIPKGKLVVCQSNNFDYDGAEEVEHFEKFKNGLDFETVLFEGIMPCGGYDRYMVIGYK